MLLGGDEFMRTQRGNNNAYCQDNEISWLDWDDAERSRDMLAFFRKAIALCRRFPVLQCRKFFTGRDQNANGIPDIRWFGTNLDEPAWQDFDLRTLCYQLDGSEAVNGPREYVLLIVFNADYRARSVRIPEPPCGKIWYRVVDTSLDTGEDIADPGRELPIDPPDHYLANPRSTVVLVGK
jgi:glycogen operon protein